MPASPCDEIVLRDKDYNLHGAPINSVGFTKREEIAKDLMSGLLASSVTASADEFAKRAVQAADALLKALENGNGA